MADDTSAERRGFLRALGVGAAVAATTAASATAQEPPNVVGWDRADVVRGAPVAKENQQERLKARYRETEHVAAFYRTNRYTNRY